MPVEYTFFSEKVCFLVDLQKRVASIGDLAVSAKKRTCSLGSFVVSVEREQ